MLLLLRRHDTVIVVINSRDIIPSVMATSMIVMISRGRDNTADGTCDYHDHIIIVISPVVPMTPAGQAPGATLGLRPRLRRRGGQHRQGATAARLTDGRASGVSVAAGEALCGGTRAARTSIRSGRQSPCAPRTG